MLLGYSQKKKCYLDVGLLHCRELWNYFSYNFILDKYILPQTHILFPCLTLMMLNYLVKSISLISGKPKWGCSSYVELSLRMREARGSIPRTSTTFFSFCFGPSRQKNKRERGLLDPEGRNKRKRGLLDQNSPAADRDDLSREEFLFVGDKRWACSIFRQ